MKFSIFLKKSGFLGLLDQVAADAKEASRYFGECAIKGSFGEPENVKMLDIKVHCNEKFREIEKKLNLSNISSFDREDIQSLASNFNRITNTLYTITNRIWTYNINKTLNEDLIRFAGLIEVSVDCLLRAVRDLSDPDEKCSNTNYCTEVNRQEKLGDELRDHVLIKLFADYPEPFHVIKWKDIYFDAATVLDKCVDTADVIKAITVKRT